MTSAKNQRPIMSKQLWGVSLVAGAGIGLIVALVMTIQDWKFNPGGIFRSSAGTNWPIVAETALSWFVPVAVASGVVVTLIIFLFSFSRKGPNRVRKTK